MDNSYVNQPWKKASFWRRQYASEVTTPQVAYDLIFGVVFPILCFIFDPIVFAADASRFEIIPVSQYKWFVYLFSALSIITLVVWMLANRFVKSGGGIIAGILLSAAACSFVIGIVILPLSLLGLMFVIGVLGFIPFFTAFVYLRNGIRALNITEPLVSRPALVGTLLFGALLVLGPPYAAHASINYMVTQAINDLTSADPVAVDHAVRRLKWIGWSGDTDELVWAYSREQDQARRQNLARAYKEITGNDIDTRLAILRD